MSRRKRGRRFDQDRRLYREVFVHSPSMRSRIETILEWGEDPGPATGCRELESALSALAAGEPEPEHATGALIAPVELAVAQLFHLRDAGT